MTASEAWDAAVEACGAISLRYFQESVRALKGECE